MDLHLYIDTRTRKLVNGPQDQASFVFPPLFQGDTVTLYLHGVTPNFDRESLDVYVEDPITFTGIKAALGIGPDQPPKAGTFRVRLVGQTEASVAMPFDVSQAAFVTAVNNMPTVQAVSAQGIRLDTVEPQPVNFFFIRWNDATITAQFEVVDNRLSPRSVARPVAYALPDGQVQLIKLIVLPYAFTDQFAYPALEPVQAGSIRLGNGTQNCIQGIIVPPGSTGSVSFSFATNSTTLIPVNALNTKTDASATIATALNAIYADGLIRFTVSKFDLGKYYVEFVGPLEKSDRPILGVTMKDQTPATTPMAAFPLTGPGIEFALRGQKTVELTFELEITSGEGVVTPVQQLVTIKNDMIDASMALAFDPDWQAVIDPTYPPYDPTGATIAASRAYVTGIGSGIGTGTSGTAFVVTHNLHTSNLIIEVRETGGLRRRLPDNNYIATYVNDDQVRIDFALAPTDGQYQIMLAAVVPQQLALPPHHHAIADIDGLQAILTVLQGGQNSLDLWPNIPNAKLPVAITWDDPVSHVLRWPVIPDALIPNNVPRLNEDGKLDSDIMPPGVPFIGDDGGWYVILPGPPPKTIQILTPVKPDGTGGVLPPGVFPDDLSSLPGFYAAILKALQAGPTATNLIVFGIEDILWQYPPAFALSNHCPGSKATNTRPSSLMPAVFNVTNGGNFAGGGLPLPSEGAVFKKRYTITGASSSPLAQFRERQDFKVGQIVVCNGVHWFAAQMVGTTAYPIEYNQELFAFVVGDDMLINNTRFGMDFTIQLQMKSPDQVCGQYVFKLEIGTPASVGGVGDNLSGVTWYNTLIQETLILSSATVSHRFGYAVARSSAGVRTATMRKYTAGDLAAPLPTGNGFAIRATLTKFDVGDAVPNPTGQVILKMSNATASIVKANP